MFQRWFSGGRGCRREGQINRPARPLPRHRSSVCSATVNRGVSVVRLRRWWVVSGRVEGVTTPIVLSLTPAAPPSRRRNGTKRRSSTMSSRTTSCSGLSRSCGPATFAASFMSGIGVPTGTIGVRKFTPLFQSRRRRRSWPVDGRRRSERRRGWQGRLSS